MAAPAAPGAPVLRGVVAYVEVWSASGSENYSKTFTDQLVDMGAQVSKTLNKQVTHVVFKDGYPSTWEKARRRGLKLVSVLWVEKCRTAGAHVDEALFPAAAAPERLPGPVRRKRKCMQPKDFTPKTPETDKRLQRKLERMASELQRQRASLDEVLLFESGGSLAYSPAAAAGGQHLAMERRLQEMKDRRENLSPTSSQLTELSREGPADAPCEESLDISQDTLCPEDSATAGDLHASLDDLRGALRAADQASTAGGAAGGPDLPAAAARTPPGSPCTPGPALPPRGLQDHHPASDPGRDHDPGPAGRGPSLALAAPGHTLARAQPRAASARRRRASMAPKEAPGAAAWSPPRLQLFPPSGGPGADSVDGADATDATDSAFDDYFSPANLRERGRPAPAPTPLGRRHSLSRRERACLLGCADFSALGRPARPGPADAAPRDSQPRAGAPQPPTPPEASDPAPAEAPTTERRDSPPAGVPASVLRASASPEELGGQRDGVPDDGGPGETPRSRGPGPKGAWPRRTLVMTGMLPEQQSVVIQVVKRLRGFKLAPEVCASTTHVLAGTPGRTLNVLLGIARGCWVLAYEWVLWSLELGRWIPEEPFELSGHFPAAPVCRLARLLSAGPYRGSLFAEQPPMFIAPACDPPRSKLSELVLLCGGRVVPAPGQAGLLIGPCRGHRAAAAPRLSERWVLDCITQHKVCVPEDYLLPP